VAKVITLLDELVGPVRSWARRNGLELQEATRQLVAAGLEAVPDRITAERITPDRITPDCITLGRYQERTGTPRRMVGARLPEGLVARLDALAAEEGSTRAAVIAELLEAVFEVGDAEVTASGDLHLLGVAYPPVVGILGDGGPEPPPPETFDRGPA
jgi:hypothetical protein